MELFGAQETFPNVHPSIQSHHHSKHNKVLPYHRYLEEIQKGTG